MLLKLSTLRQVHSQARQHDILATRRELIRRLAALRATDPSPPLASNLDLVNQAQLLDVLAAKRPLAAVPPGSGVGFGAVGLGVGLGVVWQARCRKLERRLWRAKGERDELRDENRALRRRILRLEKISRRCCREVKKVNL